jgi:predicted ferric reductase
MDTARDSRAPGNRRPAGHSRAPGVAALLAGYALLVLAPTAATVVDREIFGGLAGWLGGAAGVAALAMLLLQCLSSGRFGWLTDRPGIDRTMRFHQLAGRALTLFATAHVALAIASAGPATLEGWLGAAAMVLSSSFFATGVAAFLLLLALVVLGVRRRRLPWRYERWRASHLAGAVLGAALALHHALAVGVTSSRPLLVAFWATLGSVALASVCWVHLVKPLRMKRRPLRVVRNVQVAEGIRELVLTPAGGQEVSWRAGQFAWILVEQPRVPLLDHPFSISSSPRAGSGLRFLIKARGDFTSALADVPVGACAWIDGPFGHFTLDEKDAEGAAGGRGRPPEEVRSVALFAGGIGIAPILGLLEELAARGERRPVSLIYGVAEAAQLVDADRLSVLRGQMDLWLQVYAEAGEPPEALADVARSGRPDRAAIARALRGEPGQARCYVCGPPEMMRAVARQLRELGVPARNIVSERFEYD